MEPRLIPEWPKSDELALLPAITLTNRRIPFANFSGTVDNVYNRYGDRSFHLIIEPEEFQYLSDLGFNVVQLESGDYVLRIKITRDYQDMSEWAKSTRPERVNANIVAWEYNTGDRAGTTAFLQTLEASSGAPAPAYYPTEEKL